MIKRTISISLAAVAFGIAACGGSDEPAASTAPQAPTAVGTVVTIGDNTFTPAKVRVAVGDTVTFENRGAVAHTVTGDEVDSGSIAPGESFSFTAETSGTFPYVCTFHPGMQGTIEVT